MFGPLLSFEALRVARSQRHRCFWVGLAVLLWVAMTFNYALATSPGDRTSSAAWFAFTFFLVFSWIQILAVAVLTPAYVAGLIAHLQEQKSLDLLFVSRLSNWELATGIVLPRLVCLGYLLLAGFPVLMISTILGGVVPGHVLVIYLLAASLLVGLAGISVLCSVLTRKARDAILLTYVIEMALFALPLFARRLAISGWLQAASIPHPFEVLGKVGSSDLEQFADLARPTILAYAVVGIAAYAIGCVLVRRTYLRRRFGAVALRNRFQKRPPLGDFNPVLWRERYERGKSWAARLGNAAVFLACLAAVAHCGVQTVVYFLSEGSRQAVMHQMSVSLAAYTAALGCLQLFIMMSRAASSIPVERENGTLDSLAMTPLESKEIARGKILAAMLASPTAAVAVAVCWLIISPAVPRLLAFLPILALQFGVNAALASLVGYVVGAKCASSGRAVMRAVAISLAASLGTTFCCCAPAGFGFSPVAGLAMVALFAFGGVRQFPWPFLLIGILVCIPIMISLAVAADDSFDQHVRGEAEKNELKRLERVRRLGKFLGTSRDKPS